MKHVRNYYGKEGGRVHITPLGTGNVPALCGMQPTSVTNFTVPPHVPESLQASGRWKTTNEPIDCQRCIQRLETVAMLYAKEHGKRSLLRTRW